MKIPIFHLLSLYFTQILYNSVKLLYRCHIDYRNWIERARPLGESIQRAKERALNAIQEATGLYLDSCSQADGKGGTFTDRPQGRRFFSQEVIPKMPK